MARLAPQFSTNRMMSDYLERYYLPGAAAYRERTAAETAGGPAGAAGIEAWRAVLDQHWADMDLGGLTVEAGTGTAGTVHSFELELSLGGMPPDAVRVELYAEALDGRRPRKAPLCRRSSETH